MRHLLLIPDLGYGITPYHVKIDRTVNIYQQGGGRENLEHEQPVFTRLKIGELNPFFHQETPPEKAIGTVKQWGTLFQIVHPGAIKHDVILRIILYLGEGLVYDANPRGMDHIIPAIQVWPEAFLRPVFLAYPAFWFF